MGSCKTGHQADQGAKEDRSNLKPHLLRASFGHVRETNAPHGRGACLKIYAWLPPELQLAAIRPHC